MSDTSEQPASAPGLELRADCARCFALCCVAPTFAVSVDFAINKKAGKPCPNLHSDLRCGIHTQLRQQGFRGCAVYDCFGAGQKVSQLTYGGSDWRQNPQTAAQMFRVFSIMVLAISLGLLLARWLGLPGGFLAAGLLMIAVMLAIAHNVVERIRKIIR